MRRTLQLIACATAVWLAAPPTVTADPIAITSGVITLPSRLAPAAMTLTGTDGTRMFTFAGPRAIFASESLLHSQEDQEAMTNFIHAAIVLFFVFLLIGSVLYFERDFNKDL